tara:strand:+ start:3118 stop:3759 length:642 start_codon:yes stop_codon:yes gene_type:complete
MHPILHVLLTIHIVAGFTALGTSLVAAINKLANWPHRWHALAGRLFFVAMTAIFATAVPLSIATRNLFLLLIAVFSFYLALSGWSYARNRTGEPAALDWTRVLTMLASAVAMALYGSYLLYRGSNDGITLLVFAILAGFLSFKDLSILRAGGFTGNARIARHLTMMLAGSIATITAFLVVNIQFSPMLVLWLAPTALITPFIFFMNARVLKQP